ncbi:MAG: hypothetical protein PQJ46_06935, partial [Spirochaetales bacterium]|nr:hypothetical protein [Spirochaetales bacterium]
NTSGRSAFTFPKAENINFESKELRDHFDFLSELLQNSESWDISGFVYKINEKELLLDTGIERQYNSKELYKYAIFITVLGLLSIYSVILLLVRYKKITWNMNRIKSYYKKKIKRI